MGNKGPSDNSILHKLINEERRKLGLPWVHWDQDLYLLAKAHSNKMAKVGRLFHSERYALKGGECVSGGKGYHSPLSFLRSWLNSSRHRDWLLNPNVKYAGIGISKSNYGTYATWSFVGEDENGEIEWYF